MSKKEQARKYYLKNKERIKEKSRKYYRDNIESKKLYAIEWRLKHPEKVKFYNSNIVHSENTKLAKKEYRKNCKTREPEKYRAISYYRNWVHTGKIKPKNICEHCGIKGKMHGHHEDYSKPLEVVWLCPLCHRRLHLEYQIRRRA